MNDHRSSSIDPLRRTDPRDEPPSRAAVWGGRVMSGIACLFLAFDASMKVLKVPEAVQGTIDLGDPAGVLLWLGIVQVVCLVAYLVPRTAVLGAIHLAHGLFAGAALVSRSEVKPNALRLLDPDPETAHQPPARHRHHRRCGRIGSLPRGLRRRL